MTPAHKKFAYPQGKPVKAVTTFNSSNIESSTHDTVSIEMDDGSYIMFGLSYTIGGSVILSRKYNSMALSVIEASERPMSQLCIDEVLAYQEEIERNKLKEDLAKLIKKAEKMGIIKDGAFI